METKVEIFVDDEIAQESETDHDLRSLAAERLGLRGQQSIARGFKYRTPSQEEVLVYETLFPRKVDVKEYADEAIPMRVIDVLERATKSELFQKFVVWCPETRSADPVLVGITADVRGEWYGRPIILARWGAALDEFPAMLKEARRRIVEKVRREAEHYLAEAEVRHRRAMALDAENCNVVAAVQIR